MSEYRDLDALERVVNAATDGEWVSDGDGVSDRDEDIAIAGLMSEHDAEFVATFDPPTVRALIRELRAARKQLEVQS